MERNLGQNIKFLLFWLITIAILIPIFVISFLPFVLWKLTIVCFVRLFRNDIGKALPAADCWFAHDFYEGYSYCGNVIYFVLDGTLDLQNVRRGFQKTVLSAKTGNKSQFKKLFQVPVNVCGYFFWKTIPVDLTMQIHEDKTGFTMDIPHEDQLHEKLAKFMTSPFQKEYPLWEIEIFNGFKLNQSVLAFKLHHALGDGYSQRHLADRMIQKSSTYFVKEKRKSVKQKVDFLLTAPFKMLSLYRDRLFSRHLDIFRKTKFSKTGVLSTTWIPLEKMKSIRRSTGTHFATIGMSMLGGALRRYLLETRKPTEFPEFITFGHAVPKPGHPISTMVNHWGFGPFNIPFKIANAHERLLESEALFQSVLDNGLDTLVLFVARAHGLFLPPIIIGAFCDANFGIGLGHTSLPGYEKEASLFGEFKVRNMAFVTGLHCSQVAVTSAMYSHNGTVAFSVFANKDIIPDQDGINRVTRDYLHLELDELLHACSMKSEQMVDVKVN